MTATIYTTNNMAGADVNSVFLLDTITGLEYPMQPFATGTRAFGTDGSEWIYSTASITITPGNVVLFSMVPGSWSVSLIGGSTVTAPVGQLVGVVGGASGTLPVPAPSGNQSASYFWVQVAGNCPNVSCVASTNITTQLHSVPTLAGVVSSSAAGGGTSYIIGGMAITQATGSAAGPNTAVLDFPSVLVSATG